jgi:hypothetical protein
MLGLSEAARLVGRDVSTLHRAMKAGRLAYSLDRAGKRQLDSAELERVFGLRNFGVDVDTNGDRGNGVDDGQRNAAAAMHRNAVPQPKSAGKEELIAELRATIADLRARLDSEVNERRQLIALLTAPERRSWWRRWFR